MRATGEETHDCSGEVDVELEIAGKEIKTECEKD